MMRVFNYLSRVSLAAALAGSLLAPSAFGTTGFTGRNSVSVAPPDYNGNTWNGELVVYSNPTAAVSSFWGGSATSSSFDLAARNTLGAGNSDNVTGFGAIVNVSGTGAVIFNPAAIGGGANPPNNINYSTTLPANNNLDIMYGVTNVQGGGTRSLGIVALNDVANVNVAVSHGQGLASVPYSVAAGTAFNGSPGANSVNFNVTYGTDPTFTGFINAAGTVLTTAASHSNNVLEVRKPQISDYNGDGFVDFGDLDGFVQQQLGNPGDYEAANPYLASVRDYVGDLGGPGDPCNPDGAVDFGDIEGFVERLLGAGCADPSPVASSPAAVPEPSSVVLGLLGLLGLGAWSRRRRG